MSSNDRLVMAQEALERFSASLSPVAQELDKVRVKLAVAGAEWEQMTRQARHDLGKIAATQMVTLGRFAPNSGRS